MDYPALLRPHRSWEDGGQVAVSRPGSKVLTLSRKSEGDPALVAGYTQRGRQWHKGGAGGCGRGLLLTWYGRNK